MPHIRRRKNDYILLKNPRLWSWVLWCLKFDLMSLSIKGERWKAEVRSEQGHKYIFEKEENKKIMSYIQTYMGVHFDPMKPDAELLRIEDIAHALSLLCRGNGHLEHFFSVAQHCIYCCREAMARGYNSRLALACLLHDASEAYMADVPRPIKETLIGYRETEDALLRMIYEHWLGSPLTEAEDAVVREIDDDLLYFDLRELLHIEMELPPPNIHIELYADDASDFAEVEAEYLQMFRELRDKL